MRVRKMLLVLKTKTLVLHSVPYKRKLEICITCMRFNEDQLSEKEWSWIQERVVLLVMIALCVVNLSQVFVRVYVLCHSNVLYG